MFKSVHSSQTARVLSSLHLRAFFFSSVNGDRNSPHFVDLLALTCPGRASNSAWHGMCTESVLIAVANIFIICTNSIIIIIIPSSAERS